jgi:hypothetical protein
MLATGVHTQPGVCALLLGSGVSTGAGIPTGWGVVQELIRRLAAATEPESEDAADRAAQDPEAWWNEHGDGNALGYSNLLAAVAPTPAARRALLAGFFEPSGVDAELKVPGPAHRAIANLAKRGLIRVILTTNFDRLIERALEDAGVPPQVASRPAAVAGLTPLPHASVTVIKLHGDYADLDMRNTLDELIAYPPAWDALLDRIFDEYGLLISGWSADWDKALVTAMERSPSRRYPLYWDSRSSGGEAAGRLLAQLRGIVVPALYADELFTGLLDRVEALDHLAEAPLTTAMAVTRLKRYLPDPTRRIDLYDLVSRSVASAAEAAASEPVHHPELDGQALQEVFARLLAAVEPALRLLTTGIFHDRNREHTHLWVDSIQRLMLARSSISGTFQEALDRARHYPALLAMRAAGIVAVHTGRDDVLLRLLNEPTWRDHYNSRPRLSSVEALHGYRVLSPDFINSMPRWSGNKWLYPASHMLRADLREILREVLPDEDDYKWVSDRYEYRVAVVQHTTLNGFSQRQATLGAFIGEWQWDADGRPHSEVEFQSAADQADDHWAWWPIVGGPTGIADTLSALRETLQQLRRCD